MFEKILFCTDGSKNSICAQKNAIKFAKDAKARLVILSVVDLTEEFEAMAPGLTDKLIAQARETVAAVCSEAEAAGIKCEPLVRDGDAAKKILEVARETGAGAILLGTHGRKGFMGTVMGSVTRKVIAEAFIPVIVIHSKYCAA